MKIALLTCLLFCAVSGVSNPVISDPTLSSPYVWQHNSKFYLFTVTSSTETTKVFAVHESANLQTFATPKYIGNLPDGKDRTKITSPAMFFSGTTAILFFLYDGSPYFVQSANGKFDLSVDWNINIGNVYVTDCNGACTGLSIFADDDGTQHLVLVAPGKIVTRKISLESSSISPGNMKTVFTPASKGYESAISSASIVRNGNFYFLFMNGKLGVTDYVLAARAQSLADNSFIAMKAPIYSQAVPTDFDFVSDPFTDQNALKTMNTRSPVFYPKQTCVFKVTTNSVSTFFSVSIAGETSAVIVDRVFIEDGAWPHMGDLNSPSLAPDMSFSKKSFVDLLPPMNHQISFIQSMSIQFALDVIENSDGSFTVLLVQPDSSDPNLKTLVREGLHGAGTISFEYAKSAGAYLVANEVDGKIVLGLEVEDASGSAGDVDDLDEVDEEFALKASFIYSRGLFDSNGIELIPAGHPWKYLSFYRQDQPPQFVDITADTSSWEIASYPCENGMDYDVEQGKCMACADRTFSSDGKQCVVCPITSECQACDKETGKCSECNAGSEIDSYGCKLCDNTHFSSDGRTCELCNTKTSNCQTCNTQTGECKSCNPGNGYSDGSCTPCGNGYYSNGKDICDSCPDNCETCDNNGKCTKCKATYGLNATKLCDPCGDGSFSDGSHECKPCGDKTAGCILCGKDTGVCTKCKDAGLVNGNCVACKATEYTNGEGPCQSCATEANPECHSCGADSKCTKCNGGFALNSETHICGQCNDNYYNSGSDSVCTPCDVDPRCAGCDVETGECTGCTNGLGLSSDNHTCVECKEGEYTTGGYCTPCDYGNYGCAACEKTTGVCTACSVGFEIVEEACYKCDAGKYSPDGMKCLVCEKPNVIDLQQKSCTPCEAGSFYSDGKCLSCPEGQFSLAGSTQCTSDCSTIPLDSCGKLASCGEWGGECMAQADVDAAKQQQMIIIIACSAGGAILIAVVIAVVIVLVKKKRNAPVNVATTTASANSYGSEMYSIDASLQSVNPEAMYAQQSYEMEEIEAYDG